MTFQLTGQQFLLPSNLSTPSIRPLQADASSSSASSTTATPSSPASTAAAEKQTVLQTLGLIGQTLSLLLKESLSTTSTGTPATTGIPTGGVANASALANAAIQRNTTQDPTQAQRLNNTLAGVAQDPEGSKLLQAAVANGYTIEVGDPTATGAQDAADPDEVNGVTLPNQKKIIINPNAPDFEKTVVHELVHAATQADGDSKDEEGKADVIGYRVADRITGKPAPFPGLNTAQEEQLIYNNKVTNPAYASLAQSNGVDQLLSSLGISAFSA